MKTPTHSVRMRLVFLVLACVMPAAAMSVGLIVYYYERDLSQGRTNTVATARAMTAALDQYVIGVQAALSALASSELLRDNELARFHQRARAVQIHQHIATIVLVSLDGQQLLNTSVPVGTPLPSNAVPQIVAAINTGKPGFADLFTGKVLDKPFVAVGVPVMKDGKVAFALTAPIALDQLRELLVRQNLPANWVAAIIDGRGTVIARTRDHARFVGTPALPSLWERMQQVREDAIESVTLEGIPVMTAYSRSSLSGWSVAIGVPRMEVKGRLQKSLLLLLAGTGLLLTASLLLAWFYAESITRTIRGLMDQAAALGRGEKITPIRMDFREAEQLGVAFQQAAEQLGQANTALVQRNLDLQQFAFVASHDLRTPLNSMSGYLSLLQKRYASVLDAKGNDLINRAVGAVRQMDKLTEDLLSYARLDVREQSNTPVDCNEVVSSTLAFLEGCIRDSGAKIEVDALPTVHGDRGQLVQLFQNLLGNALKYCEGRPPEVHVSLERGPGEWIFLVADNGIGIAPQYQQRIFEVFKRLHTAQEFPGNGIGLAVCQRIVERHGGRIWVTSEPGKGSTFLFSIPDRKDQQT